MFSATTRTFTMDTALSEQRRVAAWRMWINARHGRGTAWARHGHCVLCVNPPLLYTWHYHAIVLTSLDHFIYSLCYFFNSYCRNAHIIRRCNSGCLDYFISPILVEEIKAAGSYSLKSVTTTAFHIPFTMLDYCFIWPGNACKVEWIIILGSEASSKINGAIRRHFGKTNE